MSVVISAILIFILLIFAVILALVAPLSEESNVSEECVADADSVLVELAKVSKNVSSVVDLV